MDEIKINDESVQNIVKALSSGLDSVFSNSMYGAVYNALNDRDEHIEMTKQQKSVTEDKQNTDTFLSRMDNETALSDVLVALSEKVGAFGEKVDAFDPNNTSSIQEPSSSPRQFSDQPYNGNVPPPSNDNSDAIKSIVDNSKESGQNSVAVLQQMLGIMQTWNQQRLETMSWEIRSYKPYYQKMNQMIDDGKFEDLMKNSTFTPGGDGGGLWSTLGKTLLALAGGAAGLMSGVLAGAVDSYGKIWKRMFKTIEEVVTGDKPTPHNPKGSEPKPPKIEEAGKPNAGELKDVVSKAENLTESGTKNVAETTKDVKAMSDAGKNVSPDAQVKRVPESTPTVSEGAELDPAGSITKGIKPEKTPWWKYESLPKALNIGKDAWKDMGWLSKSARVGWNVGKGVGSKFPIIGAVEGGLHGIDRTMDFYRDPNATAFDVFNSGVASAGDALMGYTALDGVTGALGGAMTGFARSSAAEQMKNAALSSLKSALGIQGVMSDDEYNQFNNAIQLLDDTPGVFKSLVDGLVAESPRLSEQAFALGDRADSPMKQLVAKKMAESGGATNSGAQAFFDLLYNDTISDSTIDEMFSGAKGGIFMDQEDGKKYLEAIKFLRMIVQQMDKRIDFRVLANDPTLLSTENYMNVERSARWQEIVKDNILPVQQLAIPDRAVPNDVGKYQDVMRLYSNEELKIHELRDELNKAMTEGTREMRLSHLKHGDVWKGMASLNEEDRYKRLVEMFTESFASANAAQLNDLFGQYNNALFGTIH